MQQSPETFKQGKSECSTENDYDLAEVVQVCKRDKKGTNRGDASVNSEFFPEPGSRRIFDHYSAKSYARFCRPCE